MTIRINGDGQLFTDEALDIGLGRVVRGWNGTMIDSQLRYWHQLNDPGVLLGLMTNQNQHRVDVEEE